MILRPCAAVGAAEGRARARGSRGTTAKRDSAASVKLMKPGPGDVACARSRRCGQGRDDRLGDLARLPADALGELQRHVGGEVAVVARSWGARARPRRRRRSGKAVRTACADEAGEARFRIGGGHGRKGVNPNAALYGRRRPPQTSCGSTSSDQRTRRSPCAASAARQARRKGCSAARVRRAHQQLRALEAGLALERRGHRVEHLDAAARARAPSAPRPRRKLVGLARPSSTRRAAARGGRRAGSPRARRSSSASAAKRVEVVASPPRRRAGGRGSRSGSAPRPGARRAPRARRPAPAARSSRSAARKSALKSALSASSTPTSVRRGIVVALGEHLRADEDVDLAVAHLRRARLRARPCARWSRGRRARCAPREAPRAALPRRAACRGRRARGPSPPQSGQRAGTRSRRPQWWQRSSPSRQVQHQVRAAARAGRVPGAGAAEEHRREAAAVHEDEATARRARGARASPRRARR